jgi:adenylate cyclase
MAAEIERKFLVIGDNWRHFTQGTAYRQGYLSTDKDRTVRVRTAGGRGFLTVKGLTTGVSRLEFEYEIPFADADQILNELCERPLIEKTRYSIRAGPRIWEVDEFHGDNAGLVVAEVELSSEEEVFDRPEWIGREVSNDPRFFNANLVRHPYSMWHESEHRGPE